jgi:putative Mn2+ efflux pump MntP
MDFAFFINSVLFGIGLAMDAFSVSLANGLRCPKMRLGRAATVAGVFAFFQALMPLAGWLLVHTVLEYFTVLEKFIPWIALILLLYIGGKMLYEGLRPECDEGDCGCEVSLTLGALAVQGIATSIDALSVGFTISELDFPLALIEALIIAAVTFAICLGGVFIGKKFGMAFAGKATAFGGIILIAIGFEIFISSFFS